MKQGSENASVETSMEKVITAFFNRREARTCRIKKTDDRFTQKINVPRDEAIKIGNTMKYLLWGEVIATLKGDILTLDPRIKRSQVLTVRLSRLISKGDKRLSWSSNLLYASNGKWGINGFLFDFPVEYDIKRKIIKTEIDMIACCKRILRARELDIVTSLHSDINKMGAIPDKYIGLIEAKLVFLRLTKSK